MGRIDSSPELGPFRSRTPLPLRNWGSYGLRDGTSGLWLTAHLSQTLLPVVKPSATGAARIRKASARVRALGHDTVNLSGRRDAVLDDATLASAGPLKIQTKPLEHCGLEG